MGVNENVLDRKQLLSHPLDKISKSTNLLSQTHRKPIGIPILIEHFGKSSTHANRNSSFNRQHTSTMKYKVRSIVDLVGKSQKTLHPSKFTLAVSVKCSQFELF